MASITCGNCHQTHFSVVTVQICYTQPTFICGDLYEVPAGWDSARGDWYDAYVAECPALAWETPRGHTCENGHEFVSAETRWAEGWDYFDDDEIAAFHQGRAVGGGTEIRDMQGRVVL